MRHLRIESLLYVGRLLAKLCLVIAIATSLQQYLVGQEPVTKSLNPSELDGKSETDEVAAGWVSKANRILEIVSEEAASAEVKKKLNKELASLKPTFSDDPRYVYAMVLAAMKEKRWSFANEFSTDFLKNEKDYIPIRVGNVRSLFMQGDKKLLSAIAELEQLTKELSTPDKRVTPDQLEAASKYVGLAIGYVEGPCKDHVKATIIKDLTVAADHVPEHLKESLAFARASIKDEYRVLIENGEEGLKKLRADAAEEMEKMKNDLEEKRKLAEKKSEDTKKRLESSWNDAKANWESLFKKSQELANRASILQLRRQELASTASTIIPPQPDDKGNVRPGDQQRYLQRKAQWDNTIAEVDVALSNLSIQYNETVRQGLVYESHLSSIRNQALREGINFEMESNSFSKLEKIVKGKESKKRGQPDIKIPASKLRRAREYATYDDFNFFKEQKLLTDSFPSQ